jgi:membrane protease YdiL (CAAX protease family)
MARVSFAAVKRVGIAIGWLLLFAVIAVPIIIGVASLVPGWGGPNWFFVRNGAYEVIGFGIATLVVGRLLNKYSWEGMGWGRRRLGVSLLRGVGLGAAMAIVAVLCAVVLDRATLRLTGDWNAWAAIALPLILGLILAALGEELAFRGYPLRRLADAVGVIPAIIVLAALFGLAHAKNPNATVFSIVNVGLAAIWLSVAFFSQGGMALAWGAHFGWNAGLAVLFDAPVSGYDFNVPVVEYTPGNHPWVDGGAFGPEGGIVTTFVLVLGTLYLLTRRSGFMEPEPTAAEQVAA